MRLGEILAERHNSIEDNSSNTVSSSSSIELPAEIQGLITGSDYWKRAKENRYRKLIRDGYRDTLMQLASLAKEKDSPANWFAKAASKAQWERTLEFVAKLREIANNAAEIAERLRVLPGQLKAVYKACWTSRSALRHAITAQETGKDGFKYFCWLVWKVGDHGAAGIH